MTTFQNSLYDVAGSVVAGLLQHRVHAEGSGPGGCNFGQLLPDAAGRQLAGRVLERLGASRGAYASARS